MKTPITLILIVAATVTTAFAESKPINEVAAKWEQVNAVAVYFRPTVDGQKWVNKKLSDIAPIEDISKIVLVDAMTSATDDLNTMNVYNILERDATFYQLDGKYPAISATYRAIIVTKKQSVFQIEIGKGPEGKGLARLTAETGDYGYFK